MITYTWQFEHFEKALSEDGLSDVVKVIHWRLNATDGTKHATTYGTVNLPAPDPNSFTPYANLTEEWAIAMVTNQVSLTMLQERLIAELAPPAVVMARAPWLPEPTIAPTP